MKLSKKLAKVAMVLALVGAIIVCVVPQIPNSWLVIAAMVFAAALWAVNKDHKAAPVKEEEEEEPQQRRAKKKKHNPLWLLVLAVVLAIVAIVIVSIACISNWYVIIPLVLIVPLVVFFCRKKKMKCTLTIATTLVAMLTLLTILAAIAFGWAFLFVLVALCAASIWLVYLVCKKVIWIPIAALLASLVCLAVYGMLNGGFAVLNVHTINVEEDININKGDLNLNEGDLNVDKGDINVNEGDLNVDKGDVNVNEGDLNVDKGDVNVNEGDLNVGGDANIGGNINENVQPPKEPEHIKPVHTHDYKAQVTTPTCTGKGYTTYTCSCGDSYVGDNVDALGHDYKDEVVAPTTTSKGYTKHTCTRCGDSYEDNPTDMLPAPVTPAFTLLESGNGYWVVKFEGIVSSNIHLDDGSKGNIEWLSTDTLKVVKTYDGSCYFSLTDNASGEVIYLF